MKQALRNTLNDIDALRERVATFTPWQSVACVSVLGEIGTWDKDKVVQCLHHASRLVKADFVEQRHLDEANALLGQVKAAVDALEKERYAKGKQDA